MLHIKKIIFFSFVLIVAPFSTFAVVERVEPTVTTITDAQRSVFQTISHVRVPDVVVPVAADVSVPFSTATSDMYMVVDRESELPQPTIIVTQKSASQLKLTTHAEDNVFNPQALTDGQLKTFAEFPFSERYDDKGRVIPDKTTIDITSDRLFTTESFNLLLGENISTPWRVRVSVIEDDGSERLLLPEKPLYGTTVTFPEITHDHFRIVLTYGDVLRIREIVFNEIGVPMVVTRNVRFLAFPGNAYDIYHDADEHISVSTGEAPRLNSSDDVKQGFVVKTEKNLFYRQADTDDDSIIDKHDNCVDVVNENQEDIDRNDIGDACEDFDQDGIINAMDNCPETPNRSQADIDQDTKGDVCDGEESRFLEQYPWLPMAAIAIVAIIVVGLIAVTLSKKPDDKK